MNDEITNIPKIRFKGYTEDWEQRKLEELGNLNRGKSKHRPRNDSRLFGGEYPFIQTGDVAKAPLFLTEYSQAYSEFGIQQSKLWDIGTLLITIAANVADTTILGIKAAFPDSVIGFESTSCDVVFIKNYIDLQSDLLKRKAETSSQANLNLAKLKEMNLNIPKLKEQQKIGTFFKQLDDTIALHQRELDLLRKTKQTYLQKMFPKTGEDRPEIRFAGFTEPWEQRKLGEVARRVTRKNKELDSIRPLTISAQEGLIDQNEFFNKTVASGDLSGYYLVKNGEFAYNKSYSNGYPWGAIKRLNRYDMGVLSTLYIVFKPIGINSEFLEKYYDTNYWHKEVSKYAAEGARNHGLLNIAASDFFETEIIIPSNIEEQQKIGSFFKTFDDTIALHQRNLNGLKEMKKSLLQQMFV